MTATITGALTSSCTAVPGPREALQRCSRLTVSVPPGALTEGVKRISVQNPLPPDCRTNEARRLVAVSHPTISSLSVAAICSSAPARDLTIHGTGFLVRGASASPAEVPSVTLSLGSARMVFNSPASSDASAVVPSGCRPLAGADQPVQICTDLSVRLPAGAMVGTYAVSVSNPVAQCASTEPTQFSIARAPVIASMTGPSPLAICMTGATLTITGSDFVPGAVVTYGGVRSQSTAVSADGTSLVARFGDLTSLRPNQAYPVSVKNAAGCETTAGSMVRLIEGVYTYYVDPSVLYNGVNTRITLLTSGLGGRPISVRLRNPATGTVLDYSDADVLWDPARPARAQVVVPRDSAQRAVAVGAYDATVIDGQGCGNPLSGAFRVTNQLGVGLVSITPPFGAVTENTAVVLKARATSTATPPLGLFRKTPRAYLSPTSDPTLPATEMSSVAFVLDGNPMPDQSATLTAIAPNRNASLPTGTYDVLIVNPEGTVGLLRGAYRVTQLPAPSVDTIAPGSISRASGQAVQIQGSSFRLQASCANAPGREDSCVRLRCGPIGSTAPSSLPPTVVTSATSNAVSITIDGSTLNSGDACSVRVTNSDGTYTDFAAVTVSNPSSGNNPIAFISVPPMLTGRRAPATVGARVNAAARFVYAIGGDRGTDDSALSTVEAAPIGLFGDLGSWFRIPVDLPAPRTRAGVVRIDRFLYLIGGRVPGSDTTSVLRAQILDPSDAPLMADPDLRIIRGQPGGMPAGVWYYRVSAVLSATDPANPGGETLAGDPVVLRVPSSPGNESVLRISWRANPRASAYRIYRTTAADQASGQERLACTVPSTSLDYTDDNNPASHAPACVGNAQIAPLPLGSTGAWTDQLPDPSGARAAHPLQAARASAGVALATDRTSGALRHIYAIGGRAGAAYWNNYERLTVQIDSPAAQSVVSGWTIGTQVLTARSELGVVVAGAATAPRVGSNVCVFALGGRTGPLSSTGRVEVAMLPSGGGELSAWNATFTGPGQATLSGSPAGFGSAIANDSIFLFGGATGGGSAPTNGGVSRILASPDPGCAAFAGPWQSLGTTNLRARYLGGTAIESGFVYVIGGQTSGAGATCGDGSSDTAGASCVVDGSVLGGQP